MNEIALTNQQLPENIEDLSRFALIGREKLKAVRAEISAIQKVGLAEEVLEQKRSEAQEIAELVTMAEVRIGKMLRELPKATTNHKGKNLENRSGANFLKPENSQADAEIPDEPSSLEAELSSDGEAPEPEAKIHAEEKPKTEALQEIGITKDAASRYQKMADNEDIVREAMNEARAKDDIVTRSAILNKIRQKEKAEKIRKAEQDIAGQASGDRKPVLFVGDGAAHRQPKSYDLLLTDPPYSSGGMFRGDRNQGTREKYQTSGVADAKPEFFGDNRDERSFLLWSVLWMSECWRALADGASAVQRAGTAARYADGFFA